MIMGGRVGDKSRRIDSILLLFSPTCIGCTHVPNKYTHACMRECARGVAQRVLPNASQGKTGVDGWGACKHAFVRAEVHACAVAREVTTLLQVRSSHPCIPQHGGLAAYACHAWHAGWACQHLVQERYPIYLLHQREGVLPLSPRVLLPGLGAAVPAHEAGHALWCAHALAQGVPQFHA